MSAACFAELGHDVWCRDIDPAKIATLRRGDVPIYEPGLARAGVAQELGPPALRDRARAGARARPAAVRLRRHAADLLGRRRPLARVTPSSTSCPPHRRARDRDEEHRAGRDRRLDQAAARPSWARPALAYVSNPEFLKEGSAVDDFMHPDRVVVGADADSAWAGGRGREALRAARLPDRAHRRRLRRDDQARLERLPRDQDLLHQRDRQRLRGGRRRRRARSRSAWASTRASAPTSSTPALATADRCFPKDVIGAEAARRQLRLPLPAPERGDRGQRASEAARRQQAEEAPRLARRQADRAARPRVQAQHRRHARGLERRAGRAASGRGRARAGLRPGRRGPRAGS